jgi:2-methylisocitrate lyase-like PEP mutase family enzyme
MIAMKNRFKEFLALHEGPEPLLIGNVWNVQSAKIFERKQFKAVATSSSAVAETLGYADGQEMSIEEYTYVVKRLASSVSVPLSIDLEGGYGNSAEEICGNIARLYEMGVSGINLEDSMVTGGKRSMAKADQFAEKLKEIINLLEAEKIKMFINIRSDSFLLALPNALQDALARVQAYQSTGVHGLFFPCVKDLADIKAITSQSRLPVNVMCIPGLPDFKALQLAGVKRISMGPFAYNMIYQKLEEVAQEILSDGSFDKLF